MRVDHDDSIVVTAKKTVRPVAADCSEVLDGESGIAGGAYRTISRFAAWYGMIDMIESLQKALLAGVSHPP